MFYEPIIFDDEGLELLLVLGYLLLVGLDLLASTVDVVTSILKSLLCYLPGFLLFPQAILELVQQLAVGCLAVIQRFVCLLQLLDGLEHLLAFLVIPRDGLILLLQGFRKLEDLLDLIDAFSLLLICGLAAGLTGSCSIYRLKGHAGLQRAVPSFFPHLQAHSHLLQTGPQHSILPVNPCQLLMQDLNFYTLSPILPLQALSILIQEINPGLLFVRIHIIIYRKTIMARSPCPLRQHRGGGAG